MYKAVLIIALLISCQCLRAQVPDSAYFTSIRSPQLYPAGNQIAYPVMRLNGGDQLELHFDDLDANVKNYYYTYQLCNDDWTPALVSQFDYMRGFGQVRIGTYQMSSIALTRYTHYSAVLPDANCMPVHSGNYLVKVFLDGDTSKLAFTRRMLVVDQKVNIKAQLLQPTNYELARTHQRIQLSVNTSAVNPNNAMEQIKLVILQNSRWDNALRGVKPTFYVNNVIQYNNDDMLVFPGGSEWRWLDLQSFRFQSDRVGTVNYGKTSTEIMLKNDGDRSKQPYLFYKDYDGAYFLQTTESISPVFQTDYATVDFSYVPAEHSPFTDMDLYVLGQFTGGGLNDGTRMVFNAEKGRYEKSFLLKQGFYSFCYVTIDRNDPDRKASFEFTEGNHLETNNTYTMLVYYRALGARADELVGRMTINSQDLR